MNSHAQIIPSVPSLPKSYNPTAKIVDYQHNDPALDAPPPPSKYISRLFNLARYYSGLSDMGSELEDTLSEIALEPSLYSPQPPSPTSAGTTKVARDIVPPEPETFHSPLHIACYQSNHAAIFILNKYGFSPSSVDKHNNTPLMLAALSASSGCIRAMLLKNSDPPTLQTPNFISSQLLRRNAFDYNALHLLCLNTDSAESAQMVIDSMLSLYGAAKASSLPASSFVDATFTDSKYRDATALIICVNMNCLFGVQTLVNDCDCGINLRDKDGLSPLAHASSLAHVEIAEYLIQMGANVFSPYDDGRNAVSTALSVDPASSSPSTSREAILSALLFHGNAFDVNEVPCVSLSPMHNLGGQSVSAVALSAATDNVVLLELVLSNAFHGKDDQFLIDVLSGSKFSNFSPLHAASSANAVQSISFLLSSAFLKENFIAWLTNIVREKALQGVLGDAGDGMAAKIEMKRDAERARKEEEEAKGENLTSAETVVELSTDEMIISHKVPKRFREPTSGDYTAFDEDDSNTQLLVDTQNKKIDQVLESLVPSESQLLRELLTRCGGSDGRNPLQLAVANGNQDALEVLLDKMIPSLLEEVLTAKETGNKEYTALHIAVVEVERGGGSNVGEDGHDDEGPGGEVDIITQILCICATTNLKDPTSLLAISDADNNLPLELAILSLNMKAIRTILMYFPPTVISTQCLTLAATTGEPQILHYLLTNFDIEQTLLDSNSNPNDDDKERRYSVEDLKVDLVFTGARNEKDNSEVMEILFDYFGVLAETSDSFVGLSESGLTPLCVCVWSGNYNIACWLLKNMGADAAAVDENGRNLFHALFETGDLGGTAIERWWELFGGMRGKLRERDKSGRTPLHYSCSGNGGHTGRFISTFGREAVGVDVPVEGGVETALHFAVRSKNREATRACIENGSEFDGSGKLPILWELLRTGDVDFISFVMEDVMIEEVKAGGGDTVEERETEWVIKEDLLLSLTGCVDGGGESVLFHLVDAVNDDKSVRGEEGKEESEDEEDEEMEAGSAPLKETVKKLYSQSEIRHLLSLFLRVAERFEGVKGSLNLCTRRKLDGRTVLHLAVANKSLDVVKTLIVAGSAAGGKLLKREFVEMKDNKKMTAGALAAKTGQTKMGIWLHNQGK